MDICGVDAAPSPFHKSAEKPLFDPFDRKEIKQYQPGQDRIERYWRRHEPEVPAERRIRKQHSEEYDRKRTERKPEVGTAFKGVAAGADDEDNEHLRCIDSMNQPV